MRGSYFCVRMFYLFYLCLLWCCRYCLICCLRRIFVTEFGQGCLLPRFKGLKLGLWCHLWFAYRYFCLTIEDPSLCQKCNWYRVSESCSNPLAFHPLYSVQIVINLVSISSTLNCLISAPAFYRVSTFHQKFLKSFQPRTFYSISSLGHTRSSISPLLVSLHFCW